MVRFSVFITFAYVMLIFHAIYSLCVVTGPNDLLICVTKFDKYVFICTVGPYYNAIFGASVFCEIWNLYATTEAMVWNGGTAQMHDLCRFLMCVNNLSPFASSRLLRSSLNGR